MAFAHIGSGQRGIVIAVEHQRAREQRTDQRALLGYVGGAERAVRPRLAQFQEPDPEPFEHARGFAEDGGWIAVIDALRCAVGRKSDAHPTRAPYRNQPFEHFAHETNAVAGAAAVIVGPQVGAVAQELVDQVAIRAVRLHPVEARFLGVLRCVAVIVDHPRDFVARQSPRWFEQLGAERRVGIARCASRRSRDGRLAAQEIGVNHPPHVPHLQHDPSAGIVDRGGHFFPAFDLRVVPDAGSRWPAQPFNADAGGLGDNQPRAGALAVVFDHHVVGHRSGRSATAGQRCHQDTVGRLDRAETDGLEKRSVHNRKFSIWRPDDPMAVQNRCISERNRATA